MPLISEGPRGFDMSGKIAGWDSKPRWKKVEAGPHNHNPLIDDILKPLQEELKEVLKIQLKDLEKRLRRK